MTTVRPHSTIKGWLDLELEAVNSLGGPAALDGLDPPTPKMLRSIQLRSDLLMPTMRPYTTGGDDWARRHWPWVALACERWRIANEMQAKHGPIGLTPTEIKERFTRIGKASDKILAALVELENAGVAVNDHERTKAGHIQALLNYVHLSQDRDVSLRDYLVHPDPGAFMLDAARSGGDLLRRLARLSVTAKAAAGVADTKPLTAYAVGEDAGLGAFVECLGSVWQSLTCRVPSVNSIPSRVSDQRPDFVKFVQAVADVQIIWSAAGNASPTNPRPPFNMVAPTSDAVASAFRRTRPVTQN